jgi:hypothetical protein
MQNIDQNLLKLSWQLFDKNGTGSITSEEVGMFFSSIFFFLNFCHFTPQGVVILSLILGVYGNHVIIS